jgi:hypothetical protein
VDAALSRTTKKTEKVAKPASESPTPLAKAAAAGQFAASSFATSNSEGAEFEVTAAPDWDQDSSATDQSPGDDDKA